MCWKKLFGKNKIVLPVAVPEAETVTITRHQFIEVMGGQGIQPVSLATPLDATVRLASKTELDRIAADLVFPADRYVAEVYDCEDYALQAQLRAGHVYGVTVQLGMGYMPQGYHGFAITLDTEYNIWMLEPNAGFLYAGVWFRAEENGYKPDKVLI